MLHNSQFGGLAVTPVEWRPFWAAEYHIKPKSAVAPQVKLSLIDLLTWVPYDFIRQHYSRKGSGLVS